MSGNKSIQLYERAVAVVDAELSVQEWNPAATELYGVSPDDALGQPLLELVGCDSLSRGELRQALTEHGRWRGQAEHTAASGQHLAVEWLLYRLNSHCYDRQGIVAVAWPVLPGGDVAAGETSLDDQQILLRTLVDNLPHFVYVKDVRGCTLLANRALASYLGHEDPEELVGTTDFDTYPVDRAQRFHDCEQDIIRTGIPMIGREAEITDSRGVKSHVLSTKVPFRGGDGEVLGLVGLAIDVTAQREAEQERRRLQERMAQARKMEAVGRLADGVAHDFNNILTGIMGYTDMALMSVSSGGQLHADLTEIKKAVTQAAGLTQQLQILGHRRADSARVLDLDAVVQRSLTMLGRLLGQQVAVRSLPGDGLHAIKAADGLVEQMLANLAMYAREALPRGGTLTLETATVASGDPRRPPVSVLDSGEVVLLTVGDDGPGMDPGTLSQIFEPFHHGPGGRPAREGLGLATVYGVVNQCGGFIEAESSPGQGTTFRIFFPAAEEAPEPGIEAAPQELASGDETLLLVDDEPLIRRSLRRGLERQGYRMLEADGGARALELFELHGDDIALMITDIRMPGMDGMELANLQRQQRPDLPVVFISGYADDVVARHGPAPGPLVQKPFAVEELCQVIRRQLNLVNTGSRDSRR